MQQASHLRDRPPNIQVASAVPAATADPDDRGFVRRRKRNRAIYLTLPFAWKAAGTEDSYDSITTTQTRRIHAAGKHPHRRVALSGRVAGHEFQLPAYQGMYSEARTRQVRCLLHGRPHGR